MKASELNIKPWQIKPGTTWRSSLLMVQKLVIKAFSNTSEAKCLPKILHGQEMEKL